MGGSPGARGWPGGTRARGPFPARLGPFVARLGPFVARFRPFCPASSMALSWTDLVIFTYVLGPVLRRV
jgi:hypothetical protein